MRYSLLSRFRGGLIGSLIGELWVSFSPAGATLPYKEQNPLNGSRIGIAAIEHLIRYGRLKQQNWQEICDLEPNIEALRHNCDMGQIARLALPLILYFHDNFSLLRQNLEEAKEFWQQSDRDWECLLLWAQAIALVLREKPSPNYSFAKLLSALSLENSPLLSQLNLIEQFLANGTGLERVVSELSRMGKPDRTTIALALYCFSSTPEDFRLSVMRAIQTNYQSATTAALTGTLAGVYNSYSSIPLSWRLASCKNTTISETQLSAQRLFALWCGVYEPEINYLTSYSAVASPNIIQPRSARANYFDQKY